MSSHCDSAAKDQLEAQLLVQCITSIRDPVPRFVLARGPKTFKEAAEASMKKEKDKSLVTHGGAVRGANEECDPEPKPTSGYIEKHNVILHEHATNVDTRYISNETPRLGKQLKS